MYHVMCKLSDETDYKSPWIDDVQSTLNLTGFSNCWDASDITRTWLLNALDRRLKDIEIQQWQAEVSINSLCTFYAMIKHEFGMETYLTKLKDSLKINLNKVHTWKPQSTHHYQQKEP